jgi:hypothetical protein
MLSSVSQYIFNIIPSFLPQIIDIIESVIYEGAVRSCSSLSLPGLGTPQNLKRRLLLIYIHGFNGSETTFQDLSLQGHGALASLLNESHVVHTRIYPRYKSEGDFRVAMSQLSRWYVNRVER